MKTKIIFGGGSLEKVGQEAFFLGKRCLLLTTSRTVLQNGVVKKVLQDLRRFKIKAICVTDISPNPKVEEIDRTALLYRGKIDFVIGLGGGSSIDAAKAVAFLLANDISGISGYLEQDKRIPAAALPIMAIPTTAGSGSEVTAAAILTDKKKELKAGLRSEALIPSVAIIDPSLTLTVPYTITKFTGFDVFAHAFESFISKKSNPFSDILSKESMAIVIDTLPKLLDNLQDLNLRTRMSFASMLAGINLLNVGTCLPHRMQYPIGALTDIPHGLGLSLIYFEWLKRIRMARLKKVKELNSILHKKRNMHYRADPISGIEKFIGSLKMKDHLDKWNCTVGTIDALVAGVKDHLDCDPVYSKNIIKQIYTDLLDKGVLRCKR